MKNVLQIMPEFGLAGAETMCETLCYKLHDSGAADKPCGEAVRTLTQNCC